MDTDKLSWLVLHSVPGIGPVLYHRLLETFGSPQEALSASEESLLKVPRLGKVTREILNVQQRRQAVEQLYYQLLDQGVLVYTLEDGDYPEMLRRITPPPPVVYLYGKFLPEDARSVAIIGRRKASEESLRTARRFGKAFAEKGVTVVSGYAEGVDSEAHLGALEGGGRTILVLPYGIGHMQLREGLDSADQVKAQGAILSEYYPTVPWSAGAAMMRNRLIVGLSKAVLVIEAGEGGGTMACAREALQVKVPLFVLHGLGDGNNRLIAEGGRSVADVPDGTASVLRLIP